MLGIVLAIGNTLNAGNARGGAAGFGLEILSTLMSLRSSRGAEVTLMHYVADELSALSRRTTDAEAAAAALLAAQRAEEEEEEARRPSMRSHCSAPSSVACLRRR